MHVIRTILRDLTVMADTERVSRFLDRVLLYLLLQTIYVIRRPFVHTTIGCYPEGPHPRYTLWKVAKLLGLKTVDPAWADVRVLFDDRTWSDAPLLQGARPARGPTINGCCRDISKRAVGAAFHAAFGYDLDVDPTTHRALMVVKSNENAYHDGRIVQGPIAGPDPRRVYEVFVDNEIRPGTVEVLRAVVIGSSLPFVYVKHRTTESRFESGADRIVRRPSLAVFAPAEVTHILKMCRILRLDYGELDVLRDRATSRIYVVDVNNTPYGPHDNLGPLETYRALRALAHVFADTYLRRELPGSGAPPHGGEGDAMILATKEVTTAHR
jgi:hypothetical protein